MHAVYLKKPLLATVTLAFGDTDGKWCIPVVSLQERLSAVLIFIRTSYRICQIFMSRDKSEVPTTFAHTHVIQIFQIFSNVHFTIFTSLFTIF